MTQYDTLPTITSPTILTAADMNKFKTNLDYLKNPRQVGDKYLGYHAAALSITNTTFASAHSDYELSFHTSGEPVLAVWLGNMYIATTPAAGSIYLDFEVDGSRIGDATVGSWLYTRRGSSSALNGSVNPSFVMLQKMLTLASGLHTIKFMVALSAAGTGTITADSTMWARPL